VYFWDTGIRNALIADFSPAETRRDIGGLWENYLISERLKLLAYTGAIRNTWFWRTQQRQEIDYVEEWNGQLIAHEIKWSANAKTGGQKTFLGAYPESVITTLSADDYENFLLPAPTSP
jgi:predicted AAA+ superfamily ATPase